MPLPPTLPHEPPYGPNTARIRRLLQHAAALTPAQWSEVVRRYEALAPTTPWVEADYHLGVTIDATGRAAARDALVAPIVRIAAAHGEGESGAEALLGAALALLVEDALDIDLRDTLHGPFEGVLPRGRLER